MTPAPLPQRHVPGPERLLGGFLGAVALAVPALVLLLLVEAAWEPLERADRWASRELSSHALSSPGLADALRTVEIATRAPLWWGLGLVAITVALLHGRRRVAAWALLVAITGAVLTPLLKALVGRARPVLEERLTTADGGSFPSGHATSSALGVGVVLVALLPLVRHRGVRALVVGLGLLAVLAVGVDRVAIGAHWPSDVVAGWSLAAAYLLATARAVDPLRGTQGQPLPRSRTRASQAWASRKAESEEVDAGAGDASARGYDPR
ncbi:phosphatase PAP2 family protein [Motilibacter sp. K478]|nr:phosphatase PAP2 family protein [Motilibacter aurantiacus]